MNVVGFVVRFCTTAGCEHGSGDHEYNIEGGGGGGEDCVNRKTPDNQYYIDPDQAKMFAQNLVGTPLVIAHDNSYPVGKCVSVCALPTGILLTAYIDEGHLISCLVRQYDMYKENYNASIEFTDYCKKMLSSFSLSHNRNTGELNHVSLVDQPGRAGTAVTYSNLDKKKERLLKWRDGNKFISDVLATHSAAYLTAKDRLPYQERNTAYSHNPHDVAYLNASRPLVCISDEGKVVNPKQYKKRKRHKGRIMNDKQIHRFNQCMALFDAFDKMSNRKDADGGDSDSDSSPPPTKRRRMMERMPSPVDDKSPRDDMMVNAMRDIQNELKAEIKSDIAATLGSFMEQMKEMTKSVTPVAPATQVLQVTATPVFGGEDRSPPDNNRPDTNDGVMVDAARQQQQITITGNPTKKMVSMLVDSILKE